MRVTNARVVQELLGHESMTSTQIYMSPNADDKQTAIDAVKNGVTEQMEEGAETSRLASAPNRGDTR
jgi:site-specific recombinase XerC